MRQAQETLRIASDGLGLVDITRPVADWVAGTGIATGLLTAFVRHTSASLVIQENADPSVQTDLVAFFRKLAPEDNSLYAHSMEGADDMPAHIRSALTQTSLGIPVAGGRLVLGTWQGLYLFEHRYRPHRRDVVLHLIGD